MAPLGGSGDDVPWSRPQGQHGEHWGGSLGSPEPHGPELGSPYGPALKLAAGDAIYCLPGEIRPTGTVGMQQGG